MSSRSVDQLKESLPPSFPVALIMQRSPSENPWIDHQWDAIGLVAVGRDDAEGQPARELIQEQAAVRRYLYRGFSLRLHADECESYYHNLLAPGPCCYIVATVDDDGTPQPVLLSLSFDEAHAYMEGDENLYTVPMPAEVYRWTEAYVLSHYVPQKRTRRQRQDWRRSDGEPHA